MLLQRIYNTVLAFTSYSHRVLSSARDERLGHFHIFPRHVYSTLYACGFLDSQQYVGAFQHLLWILLHSVSFYLFDRPLISPTW